MVQELARRRDFETTLRYIRFADSAKRQAVASLPDWGAAARSSKQKFQTPADADESPTAKLLGRMARPARLELTTFSSGEAGDGA